MYTPDFRSYNNNHILLSSDRVTLYSKTDSVFLFGTQAIGLSSMKTINLDAKNGIVMYAPRIELGENANQAVVLGNNLNQMLVALAKTLETVGNQLHDVGGGTMSIKATTEKIKTAGQLLHQGAVAIHNTLSEEDPSRSFILSKTTFTA